jgi:hypothetical protein
VRARVTAFLNLNFSVAPCARAAYASAVGKLKQTIEKEEQRIARTVQETQELISRQEQVNDEIAKIRDKGKPLVCFAPVLLFVRLHIHAIKANQWIESYEN